MTVDRDRESTFAHERCEARLRKRAETAEAECERRRQQMIDARDALACGDGDAAYTALTRHEAQA